MWNPNARVPTTRSRRAAPLRRPRLPASLPGLADAVAAGSFESTHKLARCSRAHNLPTGPGSIYRDSRPRRFAEWRTCRLLLEPHARASAHRKRPLAAEELKRPAPTSDVLVGVSSSCVFELRSPCGLGASPQPHTSRPRRLGWPSAAGGTSDLPAFGLAGPGVDERPSILPSPGAKASKELSGYVLTTGCSVRWSQSRSWVRGARGGLAPGWPQHAPSRSPSLQVAGFVGRPTGIEPVTPGATVRCSTN